MRNFFQSHWKAILALALLILAAALFLRPRPASAAQALAERLERHVGAIAAHSHDTRTPGSLDSAAVYIEQVLAEAGYRSTRQDYAAGGGRVRHIEAAIGNVAPGRRPERIFIVGAHVDAARGAPGADDQGSGMAAVLELARLLAGMRPSAGTDVRFVFFVNEEPPWFMDEAVGSMEHAGGTQRQQRVGGAAALETMGYYTARPASPHLPAGLEGRYPDTGNFIAFVGTLESATRVREALAAFRAASDFPPEGLAAPAHTTGVTLSDHGAYQGHGYPALTITQTAFLRYPYYRTARDPPDQLDYERMARVVTGLEKTLRALAGGARG